MIGIYKITAPDGKVYIGQTRNHTYRFFNYRTPNRTNRSHPRLHPSFDKWGVDSHIFEMIEECSIDMLNTRERFWQDHYDVLSDNGMNVFLQHTPEKKGVMREEQRLAMSIKAKGKPLAPEHKANVLAANAKNKGVKRPQWVCEKISLVKTGTTRIKASEETKLKISLAMKGLSKPTRTKEHNENRVASFKKNMIDSGRQVHNAKIVFNTATGVFYDTAKQAADAVGVSASEMCLRLNGKRVKSQTPFQYV